MKKNLLLKMLTLTLLGFCFSSAVMAKPDYAKAYDPARDPHKDLALATAKAKQENKFVLLIAGGDWCPWCLALQEYLNTEKELYADLTDVFEVMKVNYSKKNKNEAFFAKLPEYKGYPHFFVLDASGNVVLSKSTGPLEKGRSYDNAKFKIFIEHFKAQLK